jgi:hypothetical protein
MCDAFPFCIAGHWRPAGESQLIHVSNRIIVHFRKIRTSKSLMVQGENRMRATANLT